MFRSFHIAVSIAVIVVATMLPQERVAVISGRLIGPDSIPLHRARVTIMGSGLSATTDSSGTFSLPHTLSGDQTIELGHLDFETLQLPAIRIPQTTLRVNAMLQRVIPSGPAGDSARAANVMRGGRGMARTPIVVLDGVIVNYPRVPGGCANCRYPTEVDVIAIDILTGNAAMQTYGSAARFGVVSIESCIPARAARNACR